MYRRTEFTVGFGNELSFQHVIADSDDWLCRSANVLFDWQNEL
jgi:hypothetical protein